MTSPIILAVDTNSLEIAKRWIDATRESVDIYKLGLEFYLTFGSEGIRSIIDEFGVEIFLDLKLHDIPKTVSSATSAVAALNPKFLTVHASGGSAMVSAAVNAAPHVGITAVTILTSLSEDELLRVGFANPALESAVALAELATSAGAQAIVCSPLEIAAIRAVVSPEVKIITPGVRPTGTEGSDDQVRTMTPKAAMGEGADYVVIGRPITGAQVMGDAARKIYEEFSL
jgi:orotidine-5'-phosphate decarboxylase